MRYYLITVKLAVTGKVKKYMLSKKLTYALTLEKRLGNIDYIKPLQNAYIVVPITGYNKNRNALLSVGKITGIKKIYRRTGDLFSRSQFVPKDDILDLDHAYNFMRHDYPWYSRMSIYFGLLYFRDQEIKRQKNIILKKRMRYLRRHNYQNAEKAHD